MTRFLVTGGSGFIGSHLVDALLVNRKDEVTVLDRWESEPRQVHADNPGFTLVKGDVLDRDLVGDLC